MFFLLPDHNRTCFLTFNVPVPIINTLRKIIMCDLINPGFHPKNVTVIRNTSTCNNEILIHRVSLVPIQINPNQSNTFELNVMNTVDEPKYVTTNDFIGNGNPSAIIYKDIILCLLKKSEEIQMIAKADMGTGKDHICYRPVANVFFKKLKFLYVRKEMNQINQINEQINQINKIYPLDILKSIKTTKINCIEYPNYDCIGFSPELNDLNDEELKKYLKLTDIDIISKNDHYALFIESFFEMHNSVKILSLAIKEFQKKLMQFKPYLLNEFNQKSNEESNEESNKESNEESNKESNEKPSNKLRKFIQSIDIKFENILHVFAYYMNQNESVSFANCNKNHPHSPTIDLYIWYKNETKIDEIIQKTFIDLYQYLNDIDILEL